MTSFGTYCLCIQVKEDSEIVIGALGILFFKNGLYIYIGSALNGLETRINRHIKSNETKQPVTHWHIDYLLKTPQVELCSIFTKKSSEKLECYVSKKIAEFGDPVKGFGCSDCRCVSHLYKVNGCSFLNDLGFNRIMQ
jgi:Uri superfamily endonuclease